ncbi:hypothetical protein GN958_ATG04029 [Phytophthora infestans]|uniref:Uncharacterized protein n=1 Tax=Phytophthora infestans TaxID=4787 RepID=A0A8S9V0I8_PHYIN|nr:hypothetical protein GN958_ATG04029 [Phytophthora infestans]
MLRCPLGHDAAELTMCFSTCAKVQAPLDQNLVPPRLVPRVSTPAPAPVASKLFTQTVSRSARSLRSVVSLGITPVA